MHHAYAVDSINRRTYGSPDVVEVYEHAEGYTDLGERQALARVAREARGRPILDLGVGGGRTVPLLHQISDDYVGVDYSPALLRVARARFPEADLRRGDARQLTGFAEGRFFLVVFSFNGIDSVDHDERMQVLREVHRVLQPGGIFLFSTHNYDGPMQSETDFVLPPIRPTLNPLRLSLRVARFYRDSLRGLLNWRRNRQLDRKSGEYAVVSTGAHDYGLVVHHIRLQAQKRELREAGFSGPIEVLDSLRGHPVQEGDDVSNVPWFHLLVRK